VSGHGPDHQSRIGLALARPMGLPSAPRLHDLTHPLTMLPPGEIEISALR
jgi:hypothetical protein